MEKRHVDVVVISDLHLGTFGCHAAEIVNYLQSISPNLLILNGDIVDSITGGGFETPAEALKLKKKLMVIPIRGQYEQQCNAAALEHLGIKKIDKLDDDFNDHFQDWLSAENPAINYEHTTEDIVARMMQLSIAHIREKKPLLTEDPGIITLPFQ